jgi:TonB family protein
MRQRNCALVLVIWLTLAVGVRAQSSVQTQTVTGGRPLPGNVTPAKVIHYEPPKYPKDAKKAGVSGTVVLKAIIAKDGSVKNLEYVSGPDMLVDAAIKAVKKWKYQPTLFDGKPVEMDTKISVVFDLNHS